jgi:hypothetical protein
MADGVSESTIEDPILVDVMPYSPSALKAADAGQARRAVSRAGCRVSPEKYTGTTVDEAMTGNDPPLTICGIDGVKAG